MPVIIRCSVCNKPIGYIDTPCIFSPRYIESNGDVTISGGYYGADENYFSCSEECHQELIKKHPQEQMKDWVIRTSGTF